MTAPEPVTPTRIIPAGQPLPALPDGPPGPGDLPPWRQPTGDPDPSQPTPASDPPPTDDPDDPGLPPIHLTITLAPPDSSDPDDGGPGRWERLTDGIRGRVKPWQAAAALTLAVAPIPGVGYSTATVWAYTVGQARDQFGTGWGYAVGTVPLALVTTLIVRRGGTVVRLWLLAVAAVGMTGAISLFDPITALTGVRP